MSLHDDLKDDLYAQLNITEYVGGQRTSCTVDAKSWPKFDITDPTLVHQWPQTNPAQPDLAATSPVNLLSLVDAILVLAAAIDAL